MSYPNKDSYEGEWAEGMKSGEGTYLFLDGSSYKGIWEGDDRNGEGE